MTAKRGSAKAGPSGTYQRLLDGKIKSSRYADVVKRSVGLKPNSSTNAKPKSA